MVSDASYYRLTLDAPGTADAAAAARVYTALEADASAALHANETCMLLGAAPPSPSLAHCRFPRSCRSCLRKRGCFVHPSGLCADTAASDYMTLTNFAFAGRAQLTNPARQRWFFPAERAEYCAESDSASAACRAESRAFAAGNDSRFCEGAGGCVAIANCIDETALRAGKVVLVCAADAEAPLPGGPGVQVLTDAGRLSAGVQIMATAAGTLLLVGALLAVRLRRVSHVRRARLAELAQQRRETQRARRNKSEQLGVGALQLAGWRAHREAAAELLGDHAGASLYVEIVDVAGSAPHATEGGAVVPRDLQPQTSPRA